ncbi:MAG: hypothetical protein CSB48_02635 [Proteobacteria bacterium]|nr:MAG: hypothetical protein CSB48_02635 [Pseudomonadota bacterium]
MNFLTGVIVVVSLFLGGYSQFAIAEIAEEETVLPYWKGHLEEINNDLQHIQDLYLKGEKKEALEATQESHFTHYRNSDLEAAIRSNYSMRHAEEINQKFFSLARQVVREGNQEKQIKALVAGIKSDILVTLPGLPLTPKLLREKAKQLAKKEAERIEKKNYSQDIKALNDALDQVVEQYKKSNATQALQSIRSNFYQHWQTSELEASLSQDYRHSVEQSFDRLYKNIQQGKPAAEVGKEVAYLKAALEKTDENKIQVREKAGHERKIVIVIVAGLAVLLILTFAVWRFKRFSRY